MTDELKRLSDELHRSQPRVLSRAKGMNAAMAAFEEEFKGSSKAQKPSELVTRISEINTSGSSVLEGTEVDAQSALSAHSHSANQENPPPVQGSDSHRRLKGQNAPRGGVKFRRRSMTSRIPTLNMMFGGTAVAAALAALVVLPDVQNRIHTPVDGRVSQDVSLPVTGTALKTVEPMALAAVEERGTLSVPASNAARASLKTQKQLLESTSTATTAFAPPAVAPAISGLQADTTSSIVAAPKILIAPSDVAHGLDRPHNRDRFQQVEDSSISRTQDAPVSTFSVDVDTASYSFMRASINRGYLPDPASIRVEELINYFPYRYEGSENAEEPFKANVTVTPTPWNADTKLMHIGIKGFTPAVGARPNANIVLLIDTSGSMQSPNKLPLLISSFKLLLNTLGGNDTVSIVSYAGSAGTVLEPTPADERNKIIAAFDSLRAGGSTAGAAGLKLAYEKAEENFEKDAVNRVILATDGDFNVGFSSPAEMKNFVEKKRESGVFLSVLGFGKGNYNDHLMQILAQNGNGVAAYIDTLSEARKVLSDEAGSALIPIAEDVKIQVEFNPARISEYRLIGYETRALNREDFNDDKVDAGEIGAGHTVTAIYELTPKGSPAELVDNLRYAEVKAEPASGTGDSEEYAFVKIRYKLPGEDTSSLTSRIVDSSDEKRTLDEAPEETRFAASVAAFGQTLRGNGKLSDYSYNEIIQLAVESKGKDEFGYRSEFINLVRLAQSLDKDR